MGLRHPPSQGVGWWPAGAIAAADFNSNRYMLNGVQVPFSTLFAAPASPNLVTRNGRQALQQVNTKYQFSDALLTLLNGTGTFVVEGDTVSADQSRIIGGTNPTALLQRGTGARTYGAWNGSNNLGLTANDQLGWNTRFKGAIAYSGSPVRRATLNAAAVLGDTNAIGTIDHLWFASDSTASYAVGWFDKVFVFPTVLSDAELRRLTVPPVAVAFFGDSLMDGTGATTFAGSVWAVVGNAFSPARPGLKIAVGGSTSTDIKNLFDGRPELRNVPSVIWAGRNNFASGATVKADIAAMVAALTTDKYAILSVINASGEANPSTGYTQITTLNSELAAIYGAHFLDVRGPLVAGGAPGGAVPDETAFAGDYPPAGYVNGSPHLNDAGYAVVAGVVSAYAASAGW